MADKFPAEGSERRAGVAEGNALRPPAREACSSSGARPSPLHMLRERRLSRGCFLPPTSGAGSGSEQEAIRLERTFRRAAVAAAVREDGARCPPPSPPVAPYSASLWSPRETASPPSALGGQREPPAHPWCVRVPIKCSGEGSPKRSVLDGPPAWRSAPPFAGVWKKAWVGLHGGQQVLFSP